MLTKKILANSVFELEEKIIGYKKTGYLPTFSIVFCSTVHDLEAVRHIHHKHDIDLFGCSSAGEILDDEIYEKALVCLLFDLDKKYYKIKAIEKINKTTYQAAFEMGAYAEKCFKNPALLVISGDITINGDDIILGLKDGLKGRELPIYGGLSSDDLKLKKTSVFSRDNLTDNGLLALVFDNEKVVVEGLATSGWEAVGSINTITKAEGNILYTINNEPALDVYLKYFGSFNNMSKPNDFSNISAQYPIQILRKEGYNVLRSPLLSNEEDKSIILAGGVKDGDQFRFSIAPGFEVIKQTIDEFKMLKNQAKEADALILFSCKGRHAALGPFIEDEIKGIYDYWSAPLIGFFTYGEIGMTNKGYCDFHNETCSAVVLKEIMD
jgi:hypothetical protein